MQLDGVLGKTESCKHKKQRRHLQASHALIGVFGIHMLWWTGGGLVMQEVSRPLVFVCMHTWLSLKDDKHLTSDEQAWQLHPLAIENVVWLR